MSQNIADKARMLVEPLAQGMGLEVVEVEFVKDGADWQLRVYIDKRGGVHIDDCEQLSKAFSLVLDNEDMINRAYSLVVSSPGLDRPLKTEADFRRYEGELLDIFMLPGRLKTGDKLSIKSRSGGKGKAGGGRMGKAGGSSKGKAGAGGMSKAGAADVVCGYLAKFEGGRIYLTDGDDGAFSVAWEDIKTVKRALRF
ncbi:MAG: hypothetical protein FWH01_07590 [Oscillospiraceae bacterium]|nr:hypothetical protein [Oscillospiraceae bacterium]